MINVMLPVPLRRLAGIDEAAVALEVEAPITQRRVLDALEDRYPMLIGTTRDRSSKRRRAYVRFFACGEDFSDADPDDALPTAVANGDEPYLIVGALSGG
ncbi:MAG: MoaD/ThiS family protein [Pseudomonadota bacterium]